METWSYADYVKCKTWVLLGHIDDDSPLYNIPMEIIVNIFSFIPPPARLVWSWDKNVDTNVSISNGGKTISKQQLPERCWDSAITSQPFLPNSINFIEFQMECMEKPVARPSRT